jgi:sulfatase modifying factor 1
VAVVALAAPLVAVTSGCSLLVDTGGLDTESADGSPGGDATSAPDATPVGDGLAPPDVSPDHASADAPDSPLSDAAFPSEASMEGGTPPSCTPAGLGQANCGATGAESCCASLEVEGGTYYRTYDSTADGGPADEANPATVSDFRLDEYLVTVGRFRQFASAVLPAGGGPGYTPPPMSGKHTHLNGGNGLVNSGPSGGYELGWVASDDANIAPTNANLSSCGSVSTWVPLPTSGSENLPINCINWWESYAFCIWDGGFLPSEAEWEYAAAGGGGSGDANGQREYPWGSTDPGAGTQYAIYQSAELAPVGAATLGKARWGQLDMAGEVWEWNLDFSAPYAACADCAYLTPDSSRVIRGGNYTDGAFYLLASTRYSFDPSDRDVTVGGVGFRCARVP